MALTETHTCTWRSFETLATATHEPLDADERRAAIEVYTEGTIEVAQLQARWRSAACER